jgi:predicted peptidase
MNWQPEWVISLIDQLARFYRVDQGRVYLAGYSMGGHGTWTIGAAVLDRFAALVPIAGGEDPDIAQKLVDIPIWAFHGAKDDVSPPSATKDLVEAIVKLGGNAKLTLYADEGHGICSLPFRDERLLAWLFAQHKIGRKAP